MKVKLNDYEIDILINGLFQQRCDYDPQTNREIDDFLLRLVRIYKTMKPCCRKKFRFESHEVRLIRMCLIEWRSRQMLSGKEGAAEAIVEIVILFTC